MTQRPYVLAFDMDGVLFDTESVKLAAFLDAFVPFCGGDDAVVEKIQAYNAAHRGIPRAEKIRFVLTDLLGRPMHGDGGDAGNVAARYAAFLAQRLPRCAPIDGLTEFLAEVDAIRYVVSSAPPPARPALDSSPSTPTLASPRSSTSTSMTSPRSTASASTDRSAPPPSTTFTHPHPGLIPVRCVPQSPLSHSPAAGVESDDDTGADGSPTVFSGRSSSSRTK